MQFYTLDLEIQDGEALVRPSRTSLTVSTFIPGSTTLS